VVELEMTRRNSALLVLASASTKELCERSNLEAAMAAKQTAL
jgi:hypothetical protein